MQILSKLTNLLNSHLIQMIHPLVDYSELNSYMEESILQVIYRLLTKTISRKIKVGNFQHKTTSK